MQIIQFWRSEISARSITTVGYPKITKDETSDADLSTAEVAFQPQTRTSRPLSDKEVAFQSQTRRSRSNLRRGSRVLCQTRRSHSNFRRVGRQMWTSRSLSDADLAFQCQTRRSPDEALASFVRHGPRPAPRFNSNVNLSSSAFQHRREPVSSASQNQSKIRVQRETCISSITDSHELGQLHPIFSPHNRE